MPTAPPILCKHPMLVTLEKLAGNDAALLSMIQGIVQGGQAADRLARIEGDGLFTGYAAGEKDQVRRRLLRAWGDEATLEQISDKLGEALQLVRRSEPRKMLRCWWLAGATSGSTVCTVTSDDDAVYFLLLTPPLDGPVVADKLTFDGDFLAQLKAQSASLGAFTDGI